MRKWLSGLMLLTLGLLAGCDEPAKPKRPPASATEGESAEDLRERRRSGTSNPAKQDDEERFVEEPRREERRRPDSGKRQAAAADEAEDARDAEADRPTRAKDE